MKAIILAAGKGTRMGFLTQYVPKPMISVGGKRFLEWIIDSIHEAGINDFLIVTGYHAETIESYFGDGRSRGVSIDYIRQTEADGTGGAVRCAREKVEGENFLLTFGDILVPAPDYKEMIDTFKRINPLCMLGVNKVDDPYLGAAVYFNGEENRIQQIIEKPNQGESTTCWNQAGVFVFQPGIFDYIQTLERSQRGEYELTEAIDAAIQAGKDVRADKLQGYRYEIGTPEDVEWMNELFRRNPDIMKFDAVTSH